MPAASSGAACEGRPPAISATGGRMLAHHLELLLAHLGRDEAEDADAPRPVAEQLGASRSSSGRTSGPGIRARARNGRPPPSATAAANSARSLTRVIGPWAIG